MSAELFCEMCGSPIRGRAYKVTLEGSQLTVCHRCYTKLQTKPGSASPVTASTQRKPVRSSHTASARRRPSRSRFVEYEVVDDYARIIKEAREKLGWSTMALAQRVMEKESVIKRIENGRLRPSIELAKRLEKVLGVKLLEPVGDEDVGFEASRDEFILTLGDAANIRIRKK